MEPLRTDNGVLHGYTLSPWFFKAYMYGIMKEEEMEMRRARLRLPEMGRERVPCLFYADNLVFYGELKNLSMLVEGSVEICKRSGLNVSHNEVK